jgi:hypothetical protein
VLETRNNACIIIWIDKLQQQISMNNDNQFAKQDVLVYINGYEGVCVFYVHSHEVYHLKELTMKGTYRAEMILAILYRPTA